MVKIWQLTSNHKKVQSIILEQRSENFPKYFKKNFKGHLITDWGQVSVATSGRRRKCDIYDFSDGYPIVSERAVSLLSDQLRDTVQVLPVKYGADDLYVLNVVSLLDCLDYEKSSFVKFEDGSISDIESYEFRFSALKGKSILKIREKPKTAIFVTDEFIDAVQKAKLIGFEFYEVRGIRRKCS